MATMGDNSHGCFWHLMEEQKIKAAIRCAVPEKDLRDGTVGCSGSSVLSWKIHRSLKDYPEALQTFVYNDCDLFVCRKYSHTNEDFLAFVFACLKRLNDHGYTIRSENCYEHTYMYELAPVLIYDFTVEGIETKLSFIQCRFGATIDSVVKRFDFDVVQAIYDFKTDSIRMDADAERNLMQGKMEVSRRVHEVAEQIVANFKRVSRFDAMRLKATLNRMRKYGRRGLLVEECLWFDVHVRFFVQRNLESKMPNGSAAATKLR